MRLRPSTVAICVAMGVLVAGPAGAQDSPGWATTQAVELTRQGREHAARGEVETAARRYLDAIGFDATYGPAYLGLGAVDEAKGDTQEAERAYAMGIDHVVAFAEGLVARGRLRARLRRVPEAIADFEAAATARPDDLAIHGELVGAYVAASALPAALAETRRMGELAAARGDARAAAEARVRAQALTMLLGDLDPITAGATGRGPVRRALWLFGRRAPR